MQNGASEKYVVAIRALHWIMAIAIAAMLTMGFIAAGIPKTDPARELYLAVHRSLGITLFGLAALRAVLRLGTAAPALPAAISSPLQRAFAQAAHFAFYVLMLLMPMSGYVMSLSMGHRVAWFGVAVPRLFGEDNARGLIAGNIHATAAYILVAALALHLGAVAWHYLIDRVNLLRRIW
jgi:cytochrome b561